MVSSTKRRLKPRWSPRRPNDATQLLTSVLKLIAFKNDPKTLRKVPKMTQYKCYVTGEKAKADPYYFGTETRLVLWLSEETFAHFIIRAGKDTMHKQIRGDIKNICMELAAIAAKLAGFGVNTEEYIDTSIEGAIKVDKFENLLTQKTESGVRILRKIKEDYKQTNKLTS